jgi:hypothetical protein
MRITFGVVVGLGSVGAIGGVIMIAACSTAADNSPSPSPTSSSSSASSASSSSSSGDLGNSSSGGTSGNALPELVFSPAHLATNTGDASIRANLVYRGGKYVTEADLQAVAKEVELRVNDGLVLVPTDVVVQAPSPNNPSSSEAFVELRPKAPLTMAWHVLSLKTIPASISPHPTSVVPPPIGAYATRFNTGSGPVLKQVLMCHSPSKIKAVFEFSEAITTPVAPAKVETYLRIEQGAKSSVFTSVPGQASAISSFDVMCPDFTATDPWRIILNPGLKSQTGVDVTTPSGATSLDQSLDFMSLPEPEPTCRLWRVP